MPVFTSARQTILKSLFPIQSTALRLATGAFRSSPVQSLDCIAGIMPLDLLFEKRILTNGLRILNRANHPLSDKIKYYDGPRFLLTNTKPFFIRSRTLMNTNQVNYMKTRSQIKDIIAPWYDFRPEICYKMHISSKDYISSRIYKLKFLEILNLYPNYKRYYTDGSKIGDSCGFGLFGEGVEVSIRIPNYATVFTCELEAILYAVKFIKSNNILNAIIFSDSMSSLKAIYNGENNTLVTEIRNILFYL